MGPTPRGGAQNELSLAWLLAVTFFIVIIILIKLWESDGVDPSVVPGNAFARRSSCLISGLSKEEPGGPQVSVTQARSVC